MFKGQRTFTAPNDNAQVQLQIPYTYYKTKHW